MAKTQQYYCDLKKPQA